MAFGIFGSKNKTKNTNDSAFTEMSTPNVPDWYVGRNKDINEDLGYIAANWGMGKMTPDQQYSIDQLSGLSRTNPGANYLRDTTNPGLQLVSGQFQNLANKGPNQIAGPAPTVTAPTIAGPGMITASAVTPTDVSSTSAYDNAGQYRDAYGTGVLDSALADYDAGVGRSANAFRAQSIGGGGQAYGAMPVAAGVLAGEAARGRGALSASIRSDILDKSFGFGGQDASRKLTADQTTAQNQLAASMANASNKLTADSANVGNKMNVDAANAGNALTASGQNAQILNSRDLANLQAKIAGDATTMSALSALANTIQTQGMNAITADNQVAQNAINALQAAGIPLNQALQVIEAQLGAQQTFLPSFGSTNTGNSRSVGTGSSTGFGFSASGK